MTTANLGPPSPETRAIASQIRQVSPQPRTLRSYRDVLLYAYVATDAIEQILKQAPCPSPAEPDVRYLKETVITTFSQLLRLLNVLAIRPGVPTEHIITPTGLLARLAASIDRLEIPVQRRLTTLITQVMLFLTVLRVCDLTTDNSAKARFVAGAIATAVPRFPELLALLPDNVMQALERLPDAPPALTPASETVRRVSEDCEIVVIDTSGARGHVDARVIAGVTYALRRNEPAGFDAATRALKDLAAFYSSTTGVLPNGHVYHFDGSTAYRPFIDKFLSKELVLLQDSMHGTPFAILDRANDRTRRRYLLRFDHSCDAFSDTPTFERQDAYSRAPFLFSVAHADEMPRSILLAAVATNQKYLASARATFSDPLCFDVLAAVLPSASTVTTASVAAMITFMVQRQIPMSPATTIVVDVAVDLALEATLRTVKRLRNAEKSDSAGPA